ncbi:hypothetical protein SAMN05192564_101953 [Paraburkholderia sartisoli]|uniref:Uncharacterized protein n=1 Tax=Paraburkholderia sartisoli TaxID=83784 RepID=A0A1H3ZZU8_9BURK|nr:hypothetical protein SAMN05192564_101953 [Paraburkholderia sartisoli]
MLSAPNGASFCLEVETQAGATQLTTTRNT